VAPGAAADSVFERWLMLASVDGLGLAVLVSGAVLVSAYVRGAAMPYRLREVALRGSVWPRNCREVPSRGASPGNPLTPGRRRAYRTTKWL
jgi:hypothetical protein